LVGWVRALRLGLARCSHESPLIRSRPDWSLAHGHPVPPHHDITSARTLREQEERYIKRNRGGTRSGPSLTETRGSLRHDSVASQHRRSVGIGTNPPPSRQAATFRVNFGNEIPSPRGLLSRLEWDLEIGLIPNSRRAQVRQVQQVQRVRRCAPMHRPMRRRRDVGLRGPARR